MAQAEVKISGRRDGKTFPSLDAWIAHVAEKDIPLILPTVALAELDAAKKANSPPSNILVDGRASTEAGIAGAKRRVQFFFVDVRLLTRAVEFAFAELTRLYTHRTGAAAATIQIWGRSLTGSTIRHERLGGIGAVGDYLTKHRNPGTYIRLIGPDVPFRRQLYYGPPGSRDRFRSISKVSGKRLDELQQLRRSLARAISKKGKTRIEVKSGDSVWNKIGVTLKSRFGRSLYVSGRWIEVPVPSWKGSTKRRQGVPAIAIGWQLKGSQVH